MALGQTFRDITGSERHGDRERHFDRHPSHHEEGRLTRVIENQTAKVPSITFLNLAIASMVASLGIATIRRRPEWANFVGLWAPAFMLMGIYNKIVKEHSHEE